MDTAPVRSATSAAPGKPPNGCSMNVPRVQSKGTKARVARQACLEALEGGGETVDARQAFRERPLRKPASSSATWIASLSRARS